MSFNERIAAAEPSRSVSLLARTKELMRTDSEIINLTAGEPDFATPGAICDEVTRQLAAGNTHYSDSRGNEDLRARIAEKLRAENHAPYAADQILITPGAKQAVYLAVRALLNPGDEAIWLAPGWVSYPAIVEMSGGVAVLVRLNYDEDYRIAPDALEAAASDRTRLLILNYPNNPTGRVLTSRDIEAVSNFLRRHPQVYLLSDEVYEKLVYDGNRTVSMASFPEFFERVITVNGFSKCSAMTGWRIGYLACNPALYDIILKLFQHTMSCTSGFLQKGALVAMDCAEDTERMRAAYERRRDLVARGIGKIPGVEMRLPQGAFYAWTRFKTEWDSCRLCEELLSRAKIAGVPGNAYGEEQVSCVRFSLAAPDEELGRMLENLEKFAEIMFA